MRTVVSVVVPSWMKESAQQLADKEGSALSTIVRRALAEMFERRQAAA